jgi:hypothetical protein
VSAYSSYYLVRKIYLCVLEVHGLVLHMTALVDNYTCCYRCWLADIRAKVRSVYVYSS